MIRSFVLAIALLAAAALPVQARDAVGGGPGHDNDFHHDRDRSEHFDHRRTFVARPFGYVYTPNCYWQPAYWNNQVYPNGYGGYAYAPQFVPGQWVCS